MKTLIISFLIFLAAASVYAQTPEPAVAVAKYHFIHVRDTTQRNMPYTEDMQLLLAQNASAYTSLDQRLQQDAMVKEVQDQVKNAADPNHLNLTITGMRPVTTEEYYFFRKDHKFYVKQKLVNDYLIEEPWPTVQWKITADTITINTLHCQKALTHFMGRDYTAWFCPDLPFQGGPWKLNGLPGLIVQAEDTKKEVIFQFKGFEDVSSRSFTVALPEGAVRATRKEFERLQEVQKKDPRAISRLPSTKIEKSPLDNIDPSRISSINVKAAPVTFSRIINNPIELPDVK